MLYDVLRSIWLKIIIYLNLAKNCNEYQRYRCSSLCSSSSDAAAKTSEAKL